MLPYQKQLVKNRLRHADAAEASPILEEISNALLSRLRYFRASPKRILSVTFCPKIDKRLLSRAYPNAEILSIDPFYFFDHVNLGDRSFDLIDANLLTSSMVDLDSFWRICLKILKPGGILLFSGFAQDTLRELKHCLSEFKQTDSVNVFPDIHDMGDALLSAKFSDPAIESESIELRYSSLKKLLLELKSLGSTKIWAEYPHLYYGKNFWKQLEIYYKKHFSTKEGKLTATVDLYYGIAFAPIQQNETNGSVSVPLSEIKRKL